MSIENKTISANLGNFSSRLNVSLEKAVSEAVVNSFHAHADTVDVYISFFENGNIDYIEVIDNGDGFTKENLDSFFELHSAFKFNIGGKGVGRATWFRFFNTVSINSTINISRTQRTRVSFTIEKDQKSVDVTSEQTNETIRSTSVKMTHFKGRQKLNTLTATLKPYLLKEMGLMLYRLNKPFAISIHFIEAEATTETQTISNKDLPVFKKNYKFSIETETGPAPFTLNCMHLESNSANKVETGFISGERPISSFDATLGIKVKAPTSQYSGQYWLLLESPLLNDGRYTTEDRERIIFPESTGLFGFDIKSQIHEQLTSAIANFFDTIAPDYIEQRNQIIREIYDLYPQYAAPQYQKVINETAIATIGRLDKHTLLKKLNEEDFSREYRFKNELSDLMKSKRLNEKTIEEITISAEKTTEQARGVLANYFWYRKAIIDQLQLFSSNKEKSEELLHELFYSRHKLTTSIDLQNCIWLLDDKFMSFSYFASEGIVKKVIQDIYGEHEEDYNSKKVMDIFIAFNRDNDDTTKDCVVIEFKALGATVDDKANAASQVKRKYAQSLRKHATNVGKIFVFIITDIDDETKSNMVSDDFHEAVTRHGHMLNYYNTANDAHICFLSTATIIGDARDRHELFFKLLREELTYSQRLGPQVTN